MKIALAIGVLGLTALLYLGGSYVLPYGESMAKIEALSQKLASQQEDFATREAAFESEIAELTSGRETLTAQLTQAQTKAKEMTTRYDALAAEKAAVHADLAALTTKANETTQALQTASQMVASLKEERINSDLKIDELQKEATLLRARQDFLSGSSENQISSLQGEIATTSAALADAEAALSALTKTRDAQAKSLTAAEGRVAELSEKAEAQTQRIETQVAQIAALSEKVDAQQARLAKAEGSVSTLQAEVQARQAAFDEKANALLINQLKVSVLRDELEALQDKSKRQDDYAALLQADLTSSTQRAVAACQTKTDDILALSGISFRGGSSTISYESEAILDEIAVVARECAENNLVLDIEGHTDNVGRRDSNLVLSMARANAVRDYLAERGVADQTMRAAGYGESDPIADNGTRDGQLQNRRIVFDWDAPRPSTLKTN